MSSVARVFEVKVRVDGDIRSYHYQAKSHEQAVTKAQKRGRILGVRKVSPSDIIGNIESIKLDQKPLGLYIGGGLYENDINLDEILGLRKPSRNKNRRSKSGRDKRRQGEEW